MKTKMMALLLTLCWTLPSLASVKAYLQDEGGFFYRPSVVIDGKKYEPGVWSGGFEFSEAMKANPSAYALAQEHERLVKKGSIFIWSGLGAALAYSIATKDKDYNPWTFLGIYSVGLFPGIYFLRQGNKALLDSINTYNGVQPISENDMKLNFYVLPSENPQVGLSLEF